MKATSRRFTVGLISLGVVASLGVTMAIASAGDNAGARVRLIVGYKHGLDTSGAAHTMSSLGIRDTARSSFAKQALAQIGAQSVDVSAVRQPFAIAALKRDPAVAYVEVDTSLKSYATPNDPMFTEGNQPEMGEIGVPAAWDTTTGSAVKIAVVDTGVTPIGDLSGAVLPGYNFVSGNTTTADDGGHGTIVSSLIAARGNNGKGMAGVCWSCKILPVKVLDSHGSGSASTVASGIVYAVNNGASIINLSLGGPDTNSTLANAINWATLKNVLVVAAAGNENTSAVSYPAAYSDVLSVAGTAPGTNSRISFSNYNSATNKWVDVAAPAKVTGMDVRANYNTGEQGTSFSSPIVAGIAGLVKSVHPTWTGWSLQNAIKSTTSPVAGNFVTYGKVDAAKALTATTDTTPPALPVISLGTNAKIRGVYPVKVSGATDARSGTRAVNLYANGASKAYDQFGPYVLNFDTRQYYGPVRLRAVAQDKAGNTSYAERVVVADNRPPTLKILSAPKNGAKVSGTVKIKMVSSDQYTVRVVHLLIGGKVLQVHLTANSTFSFAVTSKFSKTFSAQIRVYDLAGNTTNSTRYLYHR
jgi:thermitase